MNRIKILRQILDLNKANFGKLYLNDEYICYTMELSYKGNKTNISSIKEGVYKAFIKISWRSGYPKKVIELLDVEGRTSIQIHTGNWLMQILGCILVGFRVNYETDSIYESKDAFKYLLSKLDSNEDIEVEICKHEIIKNDIEIRGEFRKGD